MTSGTGKRAEVGGVNGQAVPILTVELRRCLSPVTASADRRRDMREDRGARSTKSRTSGRR